MAAFETLHWNPYYVRRLMDTLLLQRNLSVDEAVEQVRERVAGELSFSGTWLSLSAIQRGTAAALAGRAPQAN